MKKNSAANKKPHAIVLLIASAFTLIAVWPSRPEQNTRFFINWLSHGTALGNIYSAVIYFLAALTLLRNKEWSDRFDSYRGAATLYLVTMLLVYPFFLMKRPFFHDNFFEWRDFILHWGNPFFIFCWWITFPPSKPISAVRSFLWVIPGAVYMLYVLIRGATDHWYPYPVLYSQAGKGIGTVINIILLASVFFILLAQLVAWISRVNRESFRSVKS
jgi:hypothetical protein